MRRVLTRWWPRLPTPSEAMMRRDRRPMLAAVMCHGCARRWVAGRSIWHPWCAVELRHAFDLYFERVHGDDR